MRYVNMTDRKKTIGVMDSHVRSGCGFKVVWVVGFMPLHFWVVSILKNNGVNQARGGKSKTTQMGSSIFWFSNDSFFSSPHLNVVQTYIHSCLYLS
jgi:hypothetical protein